MNIIIIRSLIKEALHSNNKKNNQKKSDTMVRGRDGGIQCCRTIISCCNEGDLPNQK